MLSYLATYRVLCSLSRVFSRLKPQEQEISVAWGHPGGLCPCRSSPKAQLTFHRPLAAWEAWGMLVCPLNVLRASHCPQGPCTGHLGGGVLRAHK